MAAVFRLCHLSDPHVARDHRATLAVLDFLVGHAASRGADHLLVTGDVLDRPDARTLEAVLDRVRAHGFLSPARATILPGNHDVAGDPKRPLPPARRRRALAAFLEATAAVNRAGGVRLAPGRPVVKRLGPLELVAICTASARHPVEGEVEDGDLRRLRALRPPGARRRFVAVHHHPEPRPVGRDPVLGRTVPEGLRGGEALLRACRAAGVDYLLHGHIHGSGGALDRSRFGVRIRCQGTARGERMGGGHRRYGYDLYTFRGARLSRRRYLFDSTEVVEQLLFG